MKGVMQELAEWIQDHCENNLELTEVRVNFSKATIELFQYETGIVLSARSLEYFYTT